MRPCSGCEPDPLLTMPMPCVPGPLLKIFDAFKTWIRVLIEAQETIAAIQEERDRQTSTNDFFRTVCKRSRGDDTPPPGTPTPSSTKSSPGPSAPGSSRRGMSTPAPMTQGVLHSPASSGAATSRRSLDGSGTLWSKLRRSTPAYKRNRTTISGLAVSVLEGTRQLLREIEGSADEAAEAAHEAAMSRVSCYRGSQCGGTPRGTPRGRSSTRLSMAPPTPQRNSVASVTREHLFAQRYAVGAQPSAARQRKARQAFIAVLRDMLTLDVHELEDNLPNLVADPSVLRSLSRCLTTTNPGAEPENHEAARQLIFFANSLHNRRLVPPPPVQMMRSWTVFTPHYSEDVTLSIDHLQRLQNESANLFTILRSLHPTDWDNFKERVEMVEIEQGIDGYGDNSDDEDFANDTMQSTAKSDGAKQVKVCMDMRASVSDTDAPSVKTPGSRKKTAAGTPPSLQSAASLGSHGSLGSTSRFSVQDSGLCAAVASSHLGWDASDWELSHGVRRKKAVQVAEEVTRWASDRSQVLSRTVRGVMRYGEALRLLSELEVRGYAYAACRGE